MKYPNLKEIFPSEEEKKKHGRDNLKRVFTDGFVVVQEYHIRYRPRFKSMIIKHLAISMRGGVMMNKFYDLMEIKNKICGLDCIAVQVYPPEKEIMDSANMTHLFVFPKGFHWPLTLQRKW